MLCVVTLFFTSIFTICVASALAPFPVNDDGSFTTAVANELNPLNNGFMLMFNMTYEVATVLSLPATFATAFGFIFGYGRVIISMARSGLFPNVVACTYGEFRTPYVAILVGSLLSYLLVVVAYLVPVVQTYLFNVCILSGYTGYISQLLGFILLRIKYPAQDRQFVNPLGIAGAVYPIIVFLLSAISVIGFQNDSSVAFLIYLGIIVMSTAYYFSYAKTRQFFSDEEKFIFVQQIVKCKSSAFFHSQFA